MVVSSSAASIATMKASSMGFAGALSRLSIAPHLARLTLGPRRRLASSFLRAGLAGVPFA
jgi:hypothetical protein